MELAELRRRRLYQEMTWLSLFRLTCPHCGVDEWRYLTIPSYGVAVVPTSDWTVDENENGNETRRIELHKSEDVVQDVIQRKHYIGTTRQYRTAVGLALGPDRVSDDFLYTHYCRAAKVGRAAL